MQLVVPSAVSAAVAAAMKMRRMISQTLLFLPSLIISRLTSLIWKYEVGSTMCRALPEGEVRRLKEEVL